MTKNIPQVQKMVHHVQRTVVRQLRGSGALDASEALASNQRRAPGKKTNAGSKRGHIHLSLIHI